MNITLSAAAKLFAIELVIALLLTLFAAANPVISEKVVNSIASFFQTCYVCPIVDNLLDVLTTVVNQVYNGLAGRMTPLLIMLYSVWMAVFVIKYISSMKQKNIHDFYTELLKKTFVVIFVGVLVASAQGLLYVLDIIIFPLFLFFVEFAIEMINSAGAGTNISCASTFSSMEASVSSGGNLDALAGLKAPLSCLIESLHKALEPGVTMGAKLMFVQNIGFWPEFVGLFIFLFFIILDFLFPLQIFDSLFRFGIMLILLPLAILLSAFKITRHYIEKVFRYFVATMVHIAIISVIFAVCLHVVTGMMNAINAEYFSNGQYLLAKDNALKRMSSIEMQEFAMMAILLYMLYVFNKFNELVVMVTGLDVGDSMSANVPGSKVSMGLGVTSALTKVTRGIGRFTARAMK